MNKITVIAIFPNITSACICIIPICHLSHSHTMKTLLICQVQSAKVQGAQKDQEENKETTARWACDEPNCGIANESPSAKTMGPACTALRVLGRRSCEPVYVTKLRRRHRRAAHPSSPSCSSFPRLYSSPIPRCLGSSGGDIVEKRRQPGADFPHMPIPIAVPFSPFSISISLLEGSSSGFPTSLGGCGEAISWMKIRGFDFCCWRSRLFSLRLRLCLAESSVVVPPGTLRWGLGPASAFDLW